MAEELGERTEQPSSRRRSDARGRGQIAKSQDFGAVVDLIGALLVVILLGSTLAAGFAGITRYLLDARVSGPGLSLDSAGEYTLWATARAAILVAPAMLILFAVSFFAQFSQVGILFTLKPLQPKLERLNPLAGIKRLFSRRSIVKTAVNSAKLALIGYVVVLLIITDVQRLAALPMLELLPAAALVGKMILEMCIWVLAILLILGIIDLVYQRWQHTRDLRMTKQEVKEEMRSMEGDPETKGRRLRMARSMAIQRMRQAVPTADVVVTNPTHFSVALKYDPKTMHAPRVVAKGADFLAFRIREIAVAHRIPILERPPLARALYAGVDVGREVSPEFYAAIAEILAYVYWLENRASEVAPTTTAPTTRARPSRPSPLVPSA